MTDGLGARAEALDSNALRTFVAVCESGSFRSAQSVVHRSPAAISGRIAKLERQIGRPLFARHGRSVHINEDGKALLSYARRILSLNAEIAARFGTQQTVGRVRFGASDDYGTRWLPAILRTFARTYPAIEVSVVLGPSSEIMAQIEAETLDVGLVTLARADAQTLGTVVHKECLLWVGAASGSAAYQTPVPLALADETCAWRQMAIEACARVDRPFRIALTSEHSVGQVAALAADFAVAPLPQSMLGPGLEAIGPDVLPALPDYTVRLVTRPNSEPAVDALEQSVRAALAGSA
ncbi:MAG: LysR substrate-binding domain-containing protein [Pseudomonadota bacterium]